MTLTRDGERLRSGVLEQTLDGQVTYVKARVWLGGEGYGFEGRPEAEGLVLRVDGLGRQARRVVPWGPSSTVDPGHPVFASAWIGRGEGIRRVVRLDPAEPRGVAAHHVRVEARGEDARGRRWWFEASPPIAMWVDEDGAPVRLRTVERDRDGVARRIEWVAQP